MSIKIETEYTVSFLLSRFPHVNPEGFESLATDVTVLDSQDKLNGHIDNLVSKAQGTFQGSETTRTSNQLILRYINEREEAPNQYAHFLVEARPVMK